MIESFAFQKIFENFKISNLSSSFPSYLHAFVRPLLFQITTFLRSYDTILAEPFSAPVDGGQF